MDNRRHYSDWIKQRIQRYGFCEGTDYPGFSPVMREKPPALAVGRDSAR
ncbi:antA/AntB antirepressor family protein [Thiorhodospira sibirica]